MSLKCDEKGLSDPLCSLPSTAMTCTGRWGFVRKTPRHSDVSPSKLGPHFSPSAPIPARGARSQAEQCSVGGSSARQMLVPIREVRSISR